VAKIKGHLINGDWEDQRTGLVNALYGAKIEGKLISRGKLGRIIDNTIKWSAFQFERKMEAILGK
jgi:hypothetical protein